MDIRALVAFVGRRWWVLVLGILGAALTTYLVARSMEPVYEATTSLLVVNQTQASGSTQLNDLATTDRLTETYAQLVARPVVLDAVSSGLSGAYSSAELASKVSVSSDPNTQLLSISATDSNPETAASIANLTAQTFIEEITLQVANPGTVSVAQPALVPTSPIKPKVGLYTTVAAVLGLIVGAMLARGLDYVDDTVKTTDDLRSVLGLTPLGVIGIARKGLRGKSKDFSQLQEDYRDLRTNVHFLKMDSQLKTIAILSEGRQEGKTTTATHLAEVLAQAGNRVILVDADLHEPRLHEVYGTSNSFGLSGALNRDMDDISRALQPTGVENLRLLPSGPVPSNPSELLMSQRMGELIQTLCQSGDFVIFDSPALSVVTDAYVLAKQVDGSILVVEADRSRLTNVGEAKRRLEEARLPVLGAVLNKDRSVKRHHSYKVSGGSESIVAMQPPAARAGRRSSRAAPRVRAQR